MKSLFRKTSASQPAKFSGVGTVLISDIVNMTAMGVSFSPEELAGLLTRHLTHITSTIERHAGILLQYEGDAVLAFWHPDHREPSHAQLAFDASAEILNTLPDLLKGQKGVTYCVDIVLGTEEMAGDFFGQGKRFQVVGKAMAVADRLSKSQLVRQRSAVRMSQFTADLLKTDLGLEPSGTIPREGLEELRVLSWFPRGGAEG